MLRLIQNMKQLPFSQLMTVYAEGNLENAQEFYPHETEHRQIFLAEQDFYTYLQEGFFPVEGAVYALWEAHGKYVSALRLEPYRDGLLLEALETMPACRGKGYAQALIQAVQREFSGVKIYSHVGKGNIPSLSVHEKCGFRRISEQAVYIDGSVNSRACTLCFEGE